MKKLKIFGRIKTIIRYVRIYDVYTLERMKLIPCRKLLENGGKSE